MCLLAALAPASRATGFEVGIWSGSQWVPRDPEVSLSFQVGVRFDYQPLSPTWNLVSPRPGWTFTPPAEVHVTQTNQNGAPIEWIVCTGPITPSWSIPNGTWTGTCTVRKWVPSWPPAMWTYTVDGSFGVKNIALSEPTASVTGDLHGQQAFPFLSLRMDDVEAPSGTLNWSVAADDGSDWPANSYVATGTYQLKALSGAHGDYTGTDTKDPTATFAGSIAVGADSPGLYYIAFAASEPGAIDRSGVLSEGLAVTSVTKHSFECTGIREGVLKVWETLQGPAGMALTDSLHVWRDPDGPLSTIGGLGPSTVGSLPVQVDLPARTFPLASDYALGATYRDDLGHTYHEGEGKWATPKAYKHWIPPAVCFWGDGDGEDWEAQAAAFEAGMESTYDGLGLVHSYEGSPTAGCSFYSGRAPLGQRGGVVPPAYATKPTFLAALDEDAVVAYYGHSTGLDLQPNGGFDDIVIELRQPAAESEPEPLGSGPYEGSYDRLRIEDIEAGGSLSQARVVLLWCCSGFLARNGDGKSLGGAMADKGAKAVIGFAGEMMGGFAYRLLGFVMDALTDDGKSAGQSVVYAETAFHAWAVDQGQDGGQMTESEAEATHYKRLEVRGPGGEGNPTTLWPASFAE